MKPDAHHAAAAARPEISALTGRLRREARKVTGARAAILEVLRRAPRPLANKEILARLPAGSCNLATVYRSLHLLERMQIVRRCSFGDGAARFKLLREGTASHQHHLVCTRCTEVVEVEACCPGEVEQQISRRSGFKAVTHRLEFFGICPACQ